MFWNVYIWKTVLHEYLLTDWAGMSQGYHVDIKFVRNTYTEFAFSIHCLNTYIT